jgi:hypothetical protein
MTITHLLQSTRSPGAVPLEDDAPRARADNSEAHFIGEPLMSLLEFARDMREHPNTIRNRIKRGEGPPFFKIGRGYFVRRDAARAWIATLETNRVKEAALRRAARALNAAADALGEDLPEQVTSSHSPGSGTINEASASDGGLPAQVTSASSEVAAA